jgi:hypothetical protein
LQGAGALLAAQAVERDITTGCDLVILSKFGKLEASRQGLVAAFTAAMEAGLPILTSVSPAFAQAWADFAAPLFDVLPADPNQIDAWRWIMLDDTAVRPIAAPATDPRRR